MTDVISKTIAVLLAFTMLVLAPMTILRMQADFAMRRQILNEVTLFIDKVTDKSSVTAEEYDDLMLGINAYGGAFDVLVVRYVRIAVNDGSEVRSIYCASDDYFAAGGTVNFNPGDAVQVTVKAISRTKAQNLIQGLLRVYERPFTFTLSGMVR